MNGAGRRTEGDGDRGAKGGRAERRGADRTLDVGGVAGIDRRRTRDSMLPPR